MRSSLRTRAARFVAMLVISVIGLAPVGLVGTVAAQETPRPGGEPVFVGHFLNNQLDVVWLAPE